MVATNTDQAAGVWPLGLSRHSTIRITGPGNPAVFQQEPTGTFELRLSQDVSKGTGRPMGTPPRSLPLGANAGVALCHYDSVPGTCNPVSRKEARVAFIFQAVVPM